MKPTTMGTGLQRPSSLVMAPARNDAVLAPFVASKIVLQEEQLPAAQKLLESWDFAKMPAREIVQIGFEPERALQSTLDGFLTRLDRNTAAPVFALFDRLQKGVKDADLPTLLDKVQNAKPGMVARFFGSISGKSAGQVVHEALESVRVLLSTATGTLKDKLTALEKELATEIAKTAKELQEVDRLKLAYGVHRSDFAIAAAASEAFTVQSRNYVETRRQALAADAGNQQLQIEVQELDTKLQLLESRSLALEGTFTRLPADQEVIRQIEVAGVSTLSETLTTASSRFASIKMTLLSINAALAVRSLQQLNQSNAQLDAQLIEMRSKAVKEVAVTAAKAPGDNRLAQAAQIQKIVDDTTQLHELVETARNENATKFATAKASFEQARENLARLAQSSPTVN